PLLTSTLFPTRRSSDLEIENVSGKGIKGKYKDEVYYIGNPKFIKEQNINLGYDYENWMNNKALMTQTIVLFSNSNRVLAGIAISDRKSTRLNSSHVKIS